MQAPSSFGLIATMVGIALLTLALGAIIFAPILAIPFVVVGIAAFLAWRGKQRAGAMRTDPYAADRRRVPDTEEAAADPVRDSGVTEAATSGSDSHQRAQVPRR